IFLDSGLDAARDLLQRLLFEFALEGGGAHIADSDRKSALQEFLQGRGRPPAEYRLAREEGPDHQKLFHIEVWSLGECLASGDGSTKKEAEQKAARAALERLEHAGARDYSWMTESPTHEQAKPHQTHRESTTISEYLESLLVTALLPLFGTTFV